MNVSSTIGTKRNLSKSNQYLAGLLSSAFQSKMSRFVANLIKLLPEKVLPHSVAIYLASSGFYTSMHLLLILDTLHIYDFSLSSNSFHISSYSVKSSYSIKRLL